MSEKNNNTLQQCTTKAESLKNHQIASRQEQKPDKEPRRIYESELKLAAVNDFLVGGLIRREVVERYDIASISTLKKWLIAYKRDGEQALRQKPCGRPLGARGRNAVVSNAFSLEYFLTHAENDRLVRKLKG